MTEPVHEPACSVRGLLMTGGVVRLVTRNLAFAAAGQTSLAPTAEQPSALDLLVAALVTDLLAGLQREAVRAGLVIDDAELTVSAQLDNPLVALGVVGEAGTAALRSLTGSLYVAADAEPAALDALWQCVLERAPVYATLQRCADVRIALKPLA